MQMTDCLRQGLELWAQLCQVLELVLLQASQGHLNVLLGHIAACL